MKVNELMIGDWVHFPNMNGRVAELKDQFCEFKPLSHATYDLVQPIPLTAEILEKNGFIYSDERWIMPIMAFIIIVDNGELWLFNGYVEIHYVHELQHALRLCGLNELADNFRV